MTTEPKGQQLAPGAGGEVKNSDRDGIWDALKAHAKDKFDADRERFLADAIAVDDGGWTKHTQFHWSRTVDGDRLDYWPSRKKYQYRGKVKRGDVMKVAGVRAAATLGATGDAPPKSDDA